MSMRKTKSEMGDDADRRHVGVAPERSSRPAFAAIFITMVAIAVISFFN